VVLLPWYDRCGAGAVRPGFFWGFSFETKTEPGQEAAVPAEIPLGADVDGNATGPPLSSRRGPAKFRVSTRRKGRDNARASSSSLAPGSCRTNVTRALSRLTHREIATAGRDGDAAA